MNRMHRTGELTDNDAIIISTITNSLAPLISKHRIERARHCCWTVSVGNVPVGWFRSEKDARSFMEEAIGANGEFNEDFEWLEQPVRQWLDSQVVQPTGARS
jgi:hypothetical protein